MKDLTLEFSCICSEVSVDFHSAQIKPNLCLGLFIYKTKKQTTSIYLPNTESFCFVLEIHLSRNKHEKRRILKGVKFKSK